MPTPEEVKEKYEDWLLRIPGVVGVAAGDREIIVYVESEDVQVPSTLEGVPVVKEPIGRVIIK